MVRAAVEIKPNRWRLGVNKEKQREKEAEEKVIEWERIFRRKTQKNLPSRL